ncbi:MAG: glycoside hydrolase family 65 protein, partial [Shewanella sp.]
FRNANAAAKLLGLKVNTTWENMANNLVIEHFADGVIREHATYNGEKIKQADVNLLAYPLSEVTDAAQIKKDLEYYEVRVPERNTPAMTQAIFALLYSRIGNADKAQHFFHDAYKPNLLPPFNVIAETKGGDNPYFVTGAGGALQAVMMGFGGLEITPKGIVQVGSVLPKGWQSLTIKGVGLDKKTYTKTAK